MPLTTLLALAATVAPPDLVRVALFQSASPARLTIRGIGPWTVRLAGRTVRFPAGRAVEVAANGRRVVVQMPSGLAASAHAYASCRAGFTLSHAGLAPRRYAGDMDVAVHKGTLLAVLALPVEDYAVAVVGD